MTYSVLFADPLGASGQTIFAQHPEITTVDKRLTPDELLVEIGQHDGLIVRSATTVTAEVIAAAGKLKAIGRAGVGVDNIDVDAATKRGIIVFNAPGGNTLSTAEHAVSMLCGLARSIPQAAESMRAGRWEKGKFSGTELHGKILGVMGLGRIGSEVAKRMQAFGMRVIAFDPVVAPERARGLQVELEDLDTLLTTADFITVHTPLTPDTENCIAAPQFQKMKPTARIINCARGGIVNEADLYDALKDGVIAGAAFDVFAQEPPGESPLLQLPNFVATPHIGAATVEAQGKVAADIATQMIEAVHGRPVATAVNVPAIDPVLFEELRPFIELAERLGSFLAQYIAGHPRELRVETSGNLAQYDVGALAIAAAKGLLEHSVDEPVNYVNAPVILESRGIELRHRYDDTPIEYSHLLTVSVETDQGPCSVAGKLVSQSDSHIVRIDGYRTEVRPVGTMIAVLNHDRPGVIAFLATLLTEHQINIANMDVGRDRPGGTAVTMINVDGEIGANTREALLAHDAIIDVKVIRI